MSFKKSMSKTVYSISLIILDEKSLFYTDGRKIIKYSDVVYIGCNIGGVLYNILVYADDVVLLVRCCRALQSLIDLLYEYVQIINMTCKYFIPNNDKLLMTQSSHALPSLGIY